jgi:predicted nucleic acid-binding protein
MARLKNVARRMVKALFDTNILIDYLAGVKGAKVELARYSDKAISIITWTEVQIGTDSTDHVKVDKFLLRFEILPVIMVVSSRAVASRKQTKRLSYGMRSSG